MNTRLTSHGFDITGELEKYTSAKIASIHKHIPRKLRSEAACVIHFTQTRNETNKFNTCSITLQVSDTEFKAKETTLHMYAALDIATVHIEQQLKAHATALGKSRLNLRLKHHIRPN